TSRVPVDFSPGPAEAVPTVNLDCAETDMQQGKPETRPQKSNHGGCASFATRFCRLRLWFGGARRRAVAFDVVSIPGEVALQAVLEVRGCGEAVKFTRIDDELRGAAEAL